MCLYFHIPYSLYVYLSPRPYKLVSTDSYCRKLEQLSNLVWKRKSHFFFTMLDSFEQIYCHETHVLNKFLESSFITELTVTRSISLVSKPLFLRFLLLNNKDCFKIEVVFHFHFFEVIFHFSFFL